MPDQAAAAPTDQPVPPPDFHSPQLTIRALLTGMILGAALSICNVYLGLKIGWGMNMSITGILVGFGFWQLVTTLTGGRVKMLGLLENNINQTACSAAAAVSSAGLVSAIPALTLITGQEFTYWIVAPWIFVVCMVGISIAMGLRKQMIVVDKLPFPGGFSCAATLRDIYARGHEAMLRVAALATAAAIASGIKLLEIFKVTARTDFSFRFASEKVKEGIPFSTLGFAFDPTLLMMAVGGLIGPRACISLIVGAVLGWGVLGTQLIERGVVAPTYAGVRDWIMWPGVTLMVVSSLVSFSFAIPAITRSFRSTSSSEPQVDTGEVSRKWFLGSVVCSLILATALQVAFFDVYWWAAVFAVLLSFVLAIVAARVSGETNVTPVGAMGKVTQLAFAVLMPKSAAANLMSASVTAGAASQAGDLMHDFKCGYLVGGVARKQALAQILGSLAGALVGSLFYFILIPNPKEMLLTDNWPAPAVAAWKAVAEVFQQGLGALPPGTREAMMIAALIGAILPILEKVLPKKGVAFVPSAASLGLALVIPAYNSISMFVGAIIFFVVSKLFKTWTERFFVTVCAGIVAGESLTGAGDAIILMLKNLAAGK